MWMVGEWLVYVYMYNLHVTPLYVHYNIKGFVMSKTLESFKLRTIESLKRDNPLDDDDQERRQGRVHPPLLNTELSTHHGCFDMKFD